MVILPYKDRLALFSRYLQQLVMESLGKERDLDGAVVHQGIAVYGNKGSTDQHAYVQQLRDGVPNFFATFIEVLRDRDGQSLEVDPGVTAGDYLHGFLLGTRRALYENGRASMTITVDAVTPRTVGMLIALYERAVGLYASSWSTSTPTTSPASKPARRRRPPCSTCNTAGRGARRSGSCRRGDVRSHRSGGRRDREYRDGVHAARTTVGQLLTRYRARGRKRHVLGCADDGGPGTLMSEFDYDVLIPWRLRGNKRCGSGRRGRAPVPAMVNGRRAGRPVHPARCCMPTKAAARRGTRPCTRREHTRIRTKSVPEGLRGGAALRPHLWNARPGTIGLVQEGQGATRSRTAGLRRDRCPWPLRCRTAASTSAHRTRRARGATCWPTDR